MTVPSVPPSTGVASYDLARFSAPANASYNIETFRGGFSVLEQPRMEHVQSVRAPSQETDLIIYSLDTVQRLEKRPAPELPADYFEPRSLVSIPAGLSTDWRIANGMPRCLHVHVPHNLREEWRDDFGCVTVMPFINRTTAELDNLFANIDRELHGDNAFRKLRLQGLVLTAVSTVYRLGEAAQPRHLSSAMTPTRLRRVRSYVEENLGEEVCLETMAASIGLSPSHLSRAFKAETGLSPYAYVLKMRTERAKQMMRSGKTGLAEIALACGFASQSHFTDAFRRATGTPPARWRRDCDDQASPSKGAAA